MSLLDEFEEYLQAQDKSENTVAGYVKNIELYLRWFRESKGISFSRLYRENIREYISYLKTVKKNKPKTINTKINALVKFNEYLIDEKIQDDLVINKSDYQKVQEQYLSLAKFDIKDIEKFRQIVLQSENKRNYALVTLLAFTGLRISEALNLKISDINFETKEMLVIGKGNKTRIVFMTDKVKNALQPYLKEREKINTEHDYLFISNRNKKLNRTTVNKFFKEYSNVLDMEITPHDLRHFFCSQALESGLSIEEVAYLAGHSSFHTTMLYLHPNRKQMIDKLNKM